jgi:hypothetical protein
MLPLEPILLHHLIWWTVVFTLRQGLDAAGFIM